MDSATENILPKNSLEENPVVMASEDIYKILQFRVGEKQIEDVWEIFIENSINPILIKGWAAARNYSKPHARRWGDIDLAVAPRIYQAALEIKNTYQLQTVDIHCGLRKLDTVEWETLFENSKTVECAGTSVRILRPEDHLRVLCVHWLNDGGINKERLWDIYYAVENRPADFDWHQCLEIVGAKRRKWVICAIGLAHKYLNLKIDDTPFAEEAKNLPRWLTKSVEKEWQNTVEFKYLYRCLNSPREFIEQLKTRIPPNPIQATVETDGEFNEDARIFYQMKNTLQRLKPSLKRVVNSFNKNKSL